MTNPVRALVISYAFPPVGGAGVQRVLKLAKYLPSHGVIPTILTVSNPSVPIHDESLTRDLPDGVDVLRAPTLEPAYRAKRLAWSVAATASKSPAASAKRHLVALARRFMQPDPQVLWLPGSALHLARRLHSSEPDDVVFISAPPFSQFLLAPLARLRPGTGVVLDYRDEWTTIQNAYEMSSTGSRTTSLEATLLRSAHFVTTATDEFRAALLDRFEFLDATRVVTIPNGYDPDDFGTVSLQPPDDRFVVTYAGTVFRLTSARGLIEGVRLLHAREPRLASLLDLRFVGRIVETEAEHFADAEALGITLFGYLPHEDALRKLEASHATLCILDDVPGADRIYPAKIFEIMYLGRPCLTLAPEGALARLVREHRLGDVVHPRDAAMVAQTLARMLTEFRDGAFATLRQTVTPARDTRRFDRSRQAGEFARVFGSAAQAARAPGHARRRVERHVNRGRSSAWSA